MPYRATCVFPFFTNMPSDVMTNTFSFDSLALDLEQMATLWTPRLATFYASAHPGSVNWPNYLAPVNTWHVNWYDLSQSEPRVPLTVPLPVASVVFSPTDTPTEVSCVLSMQGTAIPGQIQARRRGRIFLGGIRGTMMTQSTVSSYPIFDPGYVTAVANAASVLAGSSDNDSWWGVLSRVNSNIVRVTNGWVDNTPDTQRRRGVDATLRTLWDDVP